MNQNQINKLLSLIRKTGDRGIIADNNSDELFVIMDSENYERFLDHTKSTKGLNEEEMMNKINRDIALWRRQNQDTDTDHLQDFEKIDQDNKLETEEDFLEEYWDKEKYDADLNLAEEFNESDTTDESDAIEINEDEIPFDELERDGFIVAGEEEGGIEEEIDEPLYFEKVDNEPLPIGEMEPISEVNINDDLVEDVANVSEENHNNFVFEEELNDVVDESEEEKFFVEPIE